MLVINYPLLSRRAAALLLLALSAGCRPDQVEHLKDTKRIGEETANWEVKRIMPDDLLRATRWAGDSLTATADTLLRRTMARALAAGGVRQAAPLCRPQAYPATDSMARKWQATLNRTNVVPEIATPDTARRVARPNTETFTYQRGITLTSSECLRCHGSLADVAPADAEWLQETYAGRVPVGIKRGQAIGTWDVTLQRNGVAEFYTMKTRKKWKPR